MAKHKEYWGRWWLLPNPGHGEFCESMFVHGLSMHQKCSNYAITNVLFGLCRSVWIIDRLVTCHNPHPEALACPFITEVLRTKEHTPIPYLSAIFTFRLTIDSIKEFGCVTEIHVCAHIVHSKQVVNCCKVQGENTQLHFAKAHFITLKP